jgi:hypothetical protein
MKLSTFQKGLLLILIAFLLIGGLVFVARIWSGDAFNKEEAQHAIYGFWISKDIKSLDFSSFWNDTQRQIYWPFLHSWLLSVFFILFGANYISARLLSLILLLAIVLLMYLLSSQLSDRSGWKIGVLSVLLALSSPIMIQYATTNTLETLGALIFLASFYLYNICEEQKTALYYVFLAVLVGLSLYTNYLYAYFIIPAFIVVALGKLGPILFEVVSLSRKGEKAALPFMWWAYRKLIFLTVLFVIVASWFLTSAFSRKIMLFMQAIFRYSGGEAPTSIAQAILYYPRAIIDSYTFSPWLGFLTLITLFLPIIAFHDEYRPINKLFTFIWTVLVLAILTVPAKAPQLIFVIAPFLLLVFSVSVFYFMEKFPKWTTAILLVIFLPALISIPKLGAVYFPAHAQENMSQVLDYFHQSVPPGSPIAASFNLQHLNPENISFRFADWGSPVMADAAMQGEDEMFSTAQYFLAIEMDSTSPYRGELLDDSIYSWNSFIASKIESGELREYSLRNFGSIGIIAKIYQKQTR